MNTLPPDALEWDTKDIRSACHALWIAAYIYRDGLKGPAAIMAATNEYASEEDALGRFFADRCTTSTSDLTKVKASDFHATYEPAGESA